MKNIPFYQDVLKCSQRDDVFEYFIKNLKPSNTDWSFFVNWEKVFANTKKIEIALNSLNYLIGKSDFDNSFRILAKESPSIIKAIPALTVRSGKETSKFKILVDYKNKKLVYEDFDFSKDDITDDDIDKYLIFLEKIGLKKIIVEQKIKNLVDYMVGVEAGLDSNGRKNRGGLVMENICEVFIKDFCRTKKYEYITQADAIKIKNKFGYNVPVDKTSRRYDFVIKTSEKIAIIETNFYGGGGSKLKSTAKEYRGLQDDLRNKHIFIWITDGYGWFNTQRPLRETFDHNDYIFNLSMIEKRVLEYILS